MSQNADVEFVRRLAKKPPYCEVLLAHIDQLEADLREARNEWESAVHRADSTKALWDDRAPSVDEIAVQMMAALTGHPPGSYRNVEHCAQNAYKAAEALVAERERRGLDGLSR